METEGFIVSGGCGAEEEETRGVLDTGVKRTVFKLYPVDLKHCR